MLNQICDSTDRRLYEVGNVCIFIKPVVALLAVRNISSYLFKQSIVEKNFLLVQRNESVHELMTIHCRCRREWRLGG